MLFNPYNRHVEITKEITVLKNEIIIVKGLQKASVKDIHTMQHNIQEITRKIGYGSCPPELPPPFKPLPPFEMPIDDDAQSVAATEISMTPISDDETESHSGASTISGLINNIKRSGFGTHNVPISISDDEDSQSMTPIR